MRKIEKLMLAAIARNARDWRKGNTRVMQVIGGLEVQLHGNRIATVDDLLGVIVDRATLVRWPTPTTKSRLRALGVNVTTLKGRTYLNGEAV